MVFEQKKGFFQEQVESAMEKVSRVSPEKKGEAFIVQHRHVQQVPETHRPGGPAGGYRRAVRGGNKVIGLQGFHGCGSELALGENHHPVEREAGGLLMVIHL